MGVTIAVLLVAGAAGLAALVVSASRGPVDPVDTTAEERALVRRLAGRPRLQRFLRQRLDRRAAGGLAVTAALAVVFATALAVGLVLDMVDGRGGLARFDAAVARWGADHADSGSIGVITAVTHLGDTAVVLPALAAAVLVDLLRHRRPEVMLFGVAVLGGEKILVNGLKAIVGRDRPAVLQLVESVGSSFPSGHAGAAAAVWPAVAMILGRTAPRTVRAVLAAMAVLIAVAVAASRALLGVHWLTDVVAGAALGYGWFLVVTVLFGGRALRLGRPFRGARRRPDAGVRA
ncbi:phosphatase PAP2 family protein [Nakamurella deserti]|uniref:phosphatase PAP2 family protein n=1 Tax=Nakamurella deserti TaxID=2164074 RepID=UPI001300839A|nr:phosphatase PAP2 family protein [Nakamurella deserti]